MTYELVRDFMFQRCLNEISAMSGRAIKEAVVEVHYDDNISGNVMANGKMARNVLLIRNLGWRGVSLEDI